MSNKTIIRRQQYSQLVKEIRGSEKYLIVGIDVAKDKHHAFMGTATGKSLFRKLIFENSLDGFSKLIKQAESVKVQNGLTKIAYGLEPTSNYHKPLGRHLIGCGCDVVLVAGKAVKNNRELIDGRWDKHDTKDAANVADLVSQGKCLYYDYPTSEIDQLRDLLSLRRRLKKEEHSLRMRIRNHLLSKYFPELDRFYSACESETLSIVRWCLDPDLLADMEFAHFFHRVTIRERGIAQRLRLQKIHRLSTESVGYPVGPAALFEARLLVGKLEDVRKQIRDITNSIEYISLDFAEYSYLLTIPGFGPYISSKVLAIIGDPFRFDNRRQVLKMAGFDLCANRSGKKSDQAVTVISKKGNSELRYALYQAALVASIRDRHFKDYYTRMLCGRERERGIKTKMRVKLAAKMLIIAWTMMKRKEVFNPDYLNKE